MPASAWTSPNDFASSSARMAGRPFPPEEQRKAWSYRAAPAGLQVSADRATTGGNGRPAILAEELAKSFGDVHALAGIHVSVDQGTILGLLGPNGAGKTTAVKIFTTLLRPDGGRAEVAGFDVVRDADRLRGAIGLAG